MSRSWGYRACGSHGVSLRRWRSGASRPGFGLESEKASLEITPEMDGEITAILVKVGTEVASGDALIELKQPCSAQLMNLLLIEVVLRRRC